MKILPVLFVFLSGAISGLPVNADTLQTGPLLFIDSQHTCEVLLDGEMVGTTPLFISRISAENNRLQLMGQDSYAEMNIVFDSGIREVTRIFSMMDAYPGSVRLRGDIQDITTFIDGTEQLFVENEAGLSITLDSGAHFIRIEKQGFLPLEYHLEVPRLDELLLDIAMLPAVELFIGSDLPEDTTMLFPNDERSLEYGYSAGESILLTPGEWTGILKSAHFKDTEVSFTLGQTSTEIDISPDYHSPEVNLIGLTEDSTIFLGEREVTSQIVDAILPLSVGVNELLILRENYLPQTYVLHVDGDVRLQTELVYSIDPVYTVERRRKLNRGLLFSGLTLLGGGLILNSDTLLLGMTREYQTYRTMKYVFLGVGGTGLLLSLTGAGLGIVSALQ